MRHLQEKLKWYLDIFFVSDSFSHLKEQQREPVRSQTTVQSQRARCVAIVTVPQSRAGCSVGGVR